MKKDIKVAVIGVGYLGRFHAQKYRALPGCTLAGVVDTSPERLREVSAELGVPGFGEVSEILKLVDAVSIAVPTSVHYEVAKVCLKAGKHLLIEKPIAPTVKEAAALVALARKKGVLMQVGYLERFNPGFLACRELITRPQFIETIRISPFLSRGSDVDVVLDLMSHDLDLVLALVPSKLRSLHGVGKSLLTERTDLANVRLIFADGCVANMTASRISNKTERKLRVFQQDSYISIDFVKPSARVYSGNGAGPANQDAEFSSEDIPLEKGDSLLAEISAFLAAIRTAGRPVVSGEEGLRTMKVAERVIKDISRNRLP